MTDRSLPASVAAVYAAVAAGRPEEAAPSFAEDTVYAYGADPVDEQARRTIVGRGEIASALAVDLTAWGTPKILASVTAGPDCFVEGRVVDAAREAVAAIAAVFQLDANGAISRAVSYRSHHSSRRLRGVSTARSTSTLGGCSSGTSTGSRPETSRAASYFTDDVVYMHPHYDPGDAERPEFRGRDGLVAGLTKRSLRPYRQRILACVRRGTECFVEGDVEGTSSPDGVAFLSSMSFAADGRIQRYAAFSAPPVVPRR